MTEKTRLFVIFGFSLYSEVVFLGLNTPTRLYPNIAYLLDMDINSV